MISQKVMFRPRRLGHGNLFVSDLNRSMEFYTRVCGLTEVFREPPIKAGFLSNGSSHHDIALMETSDKSRLGGDGHTLISNERGTRSGLNHFGWEMETEAELVEAYDRARELEVDLHRTANHQVSHSVYLFDPEGNYHEFYADASDNWREVWRSGNADVLTVKWSPEEAPPSTRSRYTADADLKPAPDAMISTRQVRHGTLVASDYHGTAAILHRGGGSRDHLFAVRWFVCGAERDSVRSRPRHSARYGWPVARVAPRWVRAVRRAGVVRGRGEAEGGGHTARNGSRSPDETGYIPEGPR